MCFAEDIGCGDVVWVLRLSVEVIIGRTTVRGD
jgi:hypothetical protein